jgi:hypothetical protein
VRWYLYTLTNKIDGKIYVGLTSRPRKRYREHLTGHGSQLVWEAVQVNGQDAFDFEVRVCTDYEYGCRLEQDCIEHFGTLSPHGYNLDSGGSVGHQIVTESRDKISIAGRARYAIPGVRVSHSDRMTAYFADPSVRERYSAAHSDLFRRRPELRKSLIEGHRDYFADPANRAKFSAANRGKEGSKGTTNGAHKLTDEEVRLIRTSKLTGRQLAADLGVSPATISNVRRYKSWTHVL